MGRPKKKKAASTVTNKKSSSLFEKFPEKVKELVNWDDANDRVKEVSLVIYAYTYAETLSEGV